MVLNATFNNISAISWRFGLLCLKPLSTIFQLYHGGSFIDGGNQDTRIKTTDLSQGIDILFHIMLYRVHFAMDGFKLTTLIAQVVVNPTTLRSRQRQPQLLEALTHE